MRKNVLLFVFTMLMCGTAFSQFSVRPQVGINFASFSKDIAGFDWEGKVGFQFGADLQIGGTFYVQPGLNFQTTKLSVANAGDMDVSRINIPVLVGVKFFEPDEGRAFGIRAFAGPNFAINVSEDLDDSIGEINVDNIKGSQIAGIIGAGFDISILFIDAMYKFGLTDVFEDLGANINNADTRKNMFMVNAGIRLGF